MRAEGERDERVKEERVDEALEHTWKSSVLWWIYNHFFLAFEMLWAFLFFSIALT